MPPLDWTIIQSLLLTIVFPSCLMAVGIMSAAFAMTRRESLRAFAASMAFIAAISAGNFRGELVPFLAVQRIPERLTSEQGAAGYGFFSGWGFETGWYSLFSVTVVAVLFETAIDRLSQSRWKSVWLAFPSGLATAIIAVWLTPWDLLSSKPWTGGLLAAVIVLDTIALRYVSQLHFGQFIPMLVAVVWGGSAAAVVVLAHSSRFAELAILLSCSVGATGIMSLIAQQRLVRFYSGPATFIPGLMLGAAQNTYSEIPIASFVLIAVAPGLLMLCQIPGFRAWCESRPVSIAVAFLIPCALAVTLAIRAEFR